MMSGVPAPRVRAAWPHEREALQSVAWPDLPPWAGSSETLRVAVAGRRDMLLGCAWEAPVGAELEAGISLSPLAQRAEAAAGALIASFRPHPTRALRWTRWLPPGDPQLPLLQEAGFIIEKRMMSYVIPLHPPSFLRLARGEALARRRLEAVDFEWSGLDERSIADVRLTCLRERLMGAREFDFQHSTGRFDPASSPVVRRRGEVSGFLVTMTGETFEAALLYVHPRWRRGGLGSLLIAESIRRKERISPGRERIVFRGDPETNSGSRRLCLRFGGNEEVASLKFQLPPVSHPA